MTNIKFNENGEMINIDTGEVLGNINNGINLNSNGAELKSLQQMGVNLPDLDDQDKEENKIIKDDNKNINNILNNNTKIINNNTFKTSKYHVNKDSFFIIKFGLLRQEDGRFIPINYESTDDYPLSEKHWVKFRMWFYNEQLQWKQSVMEYKNSLKLQVLNQEKLNQIKIKKLILDWSFGQFDENLKLLHCDGKLSDESYDMFMGLYPSIAKTIVDLMNMVLENNQ